MEVRANRTSRKKPRYINELVKAPGSPLRSRTVWQTFRKALRKEDREAFDQLMNKARGLASAAGYDPRTDPMESVFMSILVELEKEIEELRGKVEELEKRQAQ